jgi:hypothetical protein
VSQEYEPVAVVGGEVQVVQRGHHGGPMFATLAGQQPQHVGLVGEIEVRRGLIQEED